MSVEARVRWQPTTPTRGRLPRPGSPDSSGSSSAPEATGSLGSSGGVDQILEGRVRGGEIVEVDARVERDAVQIGVLQSVADIRGEQSSQVLYRVVRAPAPSRIGPIVS